MKVVIMLFATLFVGLTGPLTAQGSKPNMFPSQGACEAAIASGNFGSYVPHNFGLRGKNPRPGTKVDSLRIERPGCFNMLTFQGWKWVSQETGTQMITCNGTICGLAACWNPVKEFIFPDSPSAAPRIAVPTASRSDIFVHHDTVHVKVSGQLNLAWLNEASKPVSQKKGGFWCFQNPLKGAVCLAVAAGGVYGATKIFGGHDDGPGVTTDSVVVKKGPGVTTDSVVVGPGTGSGPSGPGTGNGDKCVATSYPNNCPASGSLSGFDRPRFGVQLQPRRIGFSTTIGFRM